MSSACQSPRVEDWWVTRVSPEAGDSLCGGAELHLFTTQGCDGSGGGGKSQAD